MEESKISTMMIQPNQESMKSGGLSQIFVKDDESRLNDFHAPIHSIRLRVNGMTPTLSLIHFKTNQRRALNLIKNNLI